jgi:hypothetical protein
MAAHLFHAYLSVAAGLCRSQIAEPKAPASFWLDMPVETVQCIARH